jgi:hypothetical protein
VVVFFLLKMNLNGIRVLFCIYCVDSIPIKTFTSERENFEYKFVSFIEKFLPSFISFLYSLHDT